MPFYIEKHKELTQVHTKEDTALGIMRWGIDNSFPQTLKNLIEQSSNAKPAIDRTKTFLIGEGFEDEDEIVSPYGLTLKQVVAIMADDYAIFKAFALQCNYNLKGEVVSINPMRITDLRFNEFDELNFASKIGYHSDFGRNSEVRKTVVKTVTKSNIKWIDRFNPKAALAQIKATKGGIDNYHGQILYYAETGHSNYPIPPLQAPINFVLADVENSILVRKETNTGFINSYILKTTLDSEDETLIALESAIEQAQGARGSGKIITMSGMSPEEMKATILEEIGGGSGSATAIIDSATKSYNLCQKVIQGAYLIPPILAGADQKVGFSAPNLIDAYYVFNAQTKPGRSVIQSELNRMLSYSIFDVKPVDIQKLELDIPPTQSKEAPAKDSADKSDKSKDK